MEGAPHAARGCDVAQCTGPGARAGRGAYVVGHCVAGTIGDCARGAGTTCGFVSDGDEDEAKLGFVPHDLVSWDGGEGVS